MRKMLCLLALFPLAAAAQDDALSYDYVQLGYTFADIDIGVLDVDADGPQIEVSAGLGDTVFVFGSYIAGQIDEQNFDADLSEATVGVGVHLPLQENLSFYGALGFARIELDNELVDVEDDGYYLRAGVRALFKGEIELRFGIERADFDELDEDTAWVVGIDLFPSRAVSFGFGYRDYDYFSIGTVSMRLHFGDGVRRGRGVRR